MNKMAEFRHLEPQRRRKPAYLDYAQGLGNLRWRHPQLWHGSCD